MLKISLCKEKNHSRFWKNLDVEFMEKRGNKSKTIVNIIYKTVTMIQ